MRLRLSSTKRARQASASGDIADGASASIIAVITDGQAATAAVP
jgi:hypothetical protein